MATNQKNSKSIKRITAALILIVVAVVAYFLADVITTEKNNDLYLDATIKKYRLDSANLKKKLTDLNNADSTLSVNLKSAISMRLTSIDTMLQWLYQQPTLSSKRLEDLNSFDQNNPVPREEAIYTVLTNMTLAGYRVQVEALLIGRQTDSLTISRLKQDSTQLQAAITRQRIALNRIQTTLSGLQQRSFEDSMTISGLNFTIATQDTTIGDLTEELEVVKNEQGQTSNRLDSLLNVPNPYSVRVYFPVAGSVPIELTENNRLGRTIKNLRNDPKVILEIDENGKALPIRLKMIVRKVGADGTENTPDFLRAQPFSTSNVDRRGNIVTLKQPIGIPNLDIGHYRVYITDEKDNNVLKSVYQDFYVYR